MTLPTTAIDLFPWNDHFNTGLPVVDGQHRRLVQLLNRLADDVAHGVGSDELERVFDELVDYTVYHFDTEDAIWQSHLPCDESTIAHNRSHAEFVTRVVQLRKNPEQRPSGDIAREALAFLSRWLVLHILEADRYMAHLVLAIEAGLPREAARVQAERQMRGATPLLTEIILNTFAMLAANAMQLKHEIAERRQSDAALLRESEKNRALLQNASDGIHILDADGKVIEASESFCAMLGYRRDEVIGADCGLWDAAADAAERQRLLLERLAREERAIFETTHRRKDGGVIDVEVCSYALQIDGQRLLFNSSRDITERKRLQRELEDHQRHLERLVAQRTSDLSLAKEAAEAASRAKSAFLANMSHELRTPMNAIMGLSAIALRRTEDPRLRDYLGKIDQAAQHLLAIINDILDISKIEAERLTLDSVDFPLKDVLDHLGSLLIHKIADGGPRLVFDTAPELANLALRGDPQRLRQILFNLAGNAVKFTAAGRIVVRTRRVERDGGALTLRFEVEDSGIGIAPADQPRLFLAFEQADGSTTRRYGGTGLGLALSKRLVQLMGGEIGVDSQPGVGSTFWFTARFLPAGGAAALPAAPAVSPEQRLREECAGMAVLLVEDEPINQEIARGLLEDAGLAVDVAGDGMAAVEQCRERPYHLILMDMQMPRLDGVDATRQIRRLPGHERTPILAMTASACEQDRQSCLDAGMDDHIAKPVNPDLLYSALLRWLSPARR